MKIAFCGSKGSGKTSASKLVAKKHGVPICSFATPLKAILRNTLSPVYKPYWYEAELKEKPFAPIGFSTQDRNELTLRIGVQVLCQLGLSPNTATTRLTEQSVINSPICQLRGITPNTMLDDIDELIRGWQKAQVDDILTPRLMMQQLGTDVMRDRWCEDIHVTMFKEANELLEGFVCDDARFNDEVEYLKSLDTKIVWLQSSETSPSSEDHKSETSIDIEHCDDALINRFGALSESIDKYL